MEGNKNRRPSTPSPSIKRTPTVKRGPVPPRVSRTESSSSKPQARSSSITSGAPKVSSRAKTPPTGARSRPKSVSAKGKSKKTGLYVFFGILFSIVLAVLFIPFKDGKNLVQIIMSGETVDKPQDDGTYAIMGEGEGNSIDKADSTDSSLQLDGEESIDLPTNDDGLLTISDDDPVLPSGNDQKTQETSSSDSKLLSIDSDMITNKTGKHYVILGSFSVKSNALNFKNKLGGNAKIIAPYVGSNLYKVSANEYSSLEEANKSLEANMEKYGVDIWILSF